MGETRKGKRIDRERRTMEAMIALYCRGKHSRADGALCGECAELREYARARLERCPYGETKPACSRCPIHCYRPDRREQIRAVMRYAGPRMLFRHPLFALWHWLDARREAPSRPARRR